MESIESLERSDNWWEFVVGLLPLWLVALVAAGVVGVALCFAVLLLIPVLVFRGWVTPIRVVYSLLPIGSLFTLESMPPAYKTPFILSFAAILTVGALVCQLIRRGPLGELALLATAVIAFLAVRLATDRFWSIYCTSTFDACIACIRDFAACKTTAQQAYPWWKVFFGF